MLFIKEGIKVSCNKRLSYKSGNVDTVAVNWLQLGVGSQVLFSSTWLSYDFCPSFSLDRTLSFTPGSVISIIPFKKIESIIVLPDSRSLDQNWCRTQLVRNLNNGLHHTNSRILHHKIHRHYIVVIRLQRYYKLLFVQIILWFKKNGLSSTSAIGSPKVHCLFCGEFSRYLLSRSS